ncbi:uncharacterized protein [Primulina eburnea]|uniref:uncharacterized protein n=1 Tax=Primulina eburnea TaxID=1245227 RepID=UPI003C6BFB13
MSSYAAEFSSSSNSESDSASNSESTSASGSESTSASNSESTSASGSKRSSESRNSLEDPEFTPEVEVVTHSRPGKEIRHVTQQMNISNADNLWYGHLSSHISFGSEPKIRTMWHIPSSHQIIIPTPDDRPYLAPKGCYTFFQHHFDAGLRFPLDDFLQKLSNYYKMHLGLLTPNALRSICCLIVLFRALDLPLSCTTFSYFLVLAKSKEGPFYVISQSNRKLFDGAPSHVKDWKKYFFFIQPPEELTCSTDWCPNFTKPELSKDYKKDKDYLHIMSVLGDRCFSIPQLLSEDLLCHVGLSPAKIKLKEDAGTRVMNALFLRELSKTKAGGSSSAPQKSITPTVTAGTKRDCSVAEKKKTGSCSTTAQKSASSPTAAVKKKKTGSSSSAPKRASSPPPRAKSPPPSGKQKVSVDPSPSVPHHGKRKISEISVVSVSSPEGSESDEEPPPASGVHPLYTSATAIVGRGPTQLAQKIMYQLPSEADAAFINSLGWSDLTRRTCSSITEGMMYIGELVERANATRSTACQDLREGMALREQLQATIDEMKATHAKELSESQARGDEFLKEKQELLKEKHELQRLTEDQAKDIQKLKTDLKDSQAELEDAKVRHAAEVSSFKEEFLKSEEFVEICGPKAFHYLGVGFEGAVGLFHAQGYPPPGAPTDFIDFESFISSLPPDS